MMDRSRAQYGGRHRLFEPQLLRVKLQWHDYRSRRRHSVHVLGSVRSRRRAVRGLLLNIHGLIVPCLEINVVQRDPLDSLIANSM